MSCDLLDLIVNYQGTIEAIQAQGTLKKPDLLKAEVTEDDKNGV